MREREYKCEPCDLIFPVWGIDEDGIFTNAATGDEQVECPVCGTDDVSKVT